MQGFPSLLAQDEFACTACCTCSCSAFGSMCCFRQCYHPTKPCWFDQGCMAMLLPCSARTCCSCQHEGVAQGNCATAAVQPASAQPHVVAPHGKELCKTLQADLARGAEGQHVRLVCIIGQLQGKQQEGGLSAQEYGYVAACMSFWVVSGVYLHLHMIHTPTIDTTTLASH